MWGETDWEIGMDMYPLRKSGESERVTVRKARGLQIEEIGCKCQEFFIALLSGRRKQATSVKIFSPFSIQA